MSVKDIEKRLSQNISIEERSKLFTLLIKTRKNEVI